MRHPITLAQQQIIIAGNEAGHSIKEIATAAHCAVQTVYLYLNRHDQPIRKRHLLSMPTTPPSPPTIEIDDQMLVNFARCFIPRRQGDLAEIAALLHMELRKVCRILGRPIPGKIRVPLPTKHITTPAESLFAPLSDLENQTYQN